MGPNPVGRTHHRLDPSDMGAIIHAVEEARPDCVFHLAGVSGPQEFLASYSINVMYGARLLEALAVTGQEGCPVLLVGTSAEYGMVDAEHLPIREETPARPYSHYGISKLAQTSMGVLVARTGRPLIMARPFNIIGPGMPEHLVIQTLARQLANIHRGVCGPVLEVGNLSASRDFVSVHDAVRIYWDLVRTPAAYGEIVNVCSGRPVVIGDLLERFMSLTGLQVEVRTDPRRVKPMDVPVHYGSPERLRRLVGFVPSGELDAVIMEIWAEVLNQP
jgi:nucleoside-diphosphate-sugar epimerase